MRGSRSIAAALSGGLVLGLLPATASSTDFFETRVRPVLVAQCYECHSAQTEKPKAGLRLDTPGGLRRGGITGPLFQAGQPESSLLIQAIRGTAHELKRMPAGKDALAAEQVAALEEWIRQGAVLPPENPAGVALADPKKHWAYQKPVRPPVPCADASDVSGPVNPVDAFVGAALRARGLHPAPGADRRTLLRRVTYDLTGLPPTPNEMEAFLADESPGAYERVVDRLLASPRYGERWARHWLDIARYADTKGYVFEEERRYPASFTYRDWVASALNRDLPYDQFIIAQIAGDALATENDRTPLAAMGFLTLGRRFLNNQADIIDDRLDVIFRGLQGLTIQCSRCHDHKSDPLPMADYYSLYGVLASSHEPDPKPLIGPNPNPIEAARYEEERAKRMKERNDFQADKVEQARRELRERVGDYLLIAHEAEAAGDKREELIRSRKLSPAITRKWQDALAKWTTELHPVWTPYSRFRALATNDFAAGAARLATELSAAAASANRFNPLVVARIATNAPANLREVTERYGALCREIDAEWQAALKSAASAGQAAPKALPDADREAVRQALYAAESPVMVEWDAAYRLVPTPDQQKFRALQRRLDELDATHPGAPLRAMALADNSSPYEPVVFKRGNPGNPGPKVPRQFLAILDPNRQPFKEGSGRLGLARALASRDNPLTARVLVNRVWLRHFGVPLVRTPSDFGVKSEPATHPELLDWLAVWFMDQGWSLKQLHRLLLTSETYRRASDPAELPEIQSNLAIDNANTYLWRMNRKRADFEGLRDALLQVSGSLDLAMGGQAVEIYNATPANRRTLYGFIDRQNLPGILRSFDFASPDTSSAMRFQTTVPQQALYLLNSPFAAEMARRTLGRPDVAGVASDRARVELLYRLAFQRRPAPEEVALALSFVTAPSAKPAAVDTPTWEYGFGGVDELTGRVVSFTPFRNFAEGRWQPTDRYPIDDLRGYAALNREGGHPGRDAAHAVIRRWHAATEATLRIRGQARHGTDAGDGIVVRVISDRQGSFGRWPVQNGTVAVNLDEVRVRAGEVLDFVVECGASDNSDSFTYAPEISVVAVEAGTSSGTMTGKGRNVWNARNDFAGPVPVVRPLTAWERYTQALLASNEFIFVD